MLSAYHRRYEHPKGKNDVCVLDSSQTVCIGFELFLCCLGLACSGSGSLAVVKDLRVCCLGIQPHRLMDRSSSSASLITSILSCEFQYIYTVHVYCARP